MCSRKLLRENDNVMRPNYRSVTTFCIASVNSVMTFSAYKSDRNIFYKQFNFGLAPQTFGLVTSSNSLPEGQPHLFIFISPWSPLRVVSIRKQSRTDMTSQSGNKAVPIWRLNQETKPYRYETMLYKVRPCSLLLTKIPALWIKVQNLPLRE